MNEQRYYSSNTFLYNVNNELNTPGINSVRFNQNIYNPTIGYIRQNTIQNINNINLNQLLVQINEMKKELNDLKTKEYKMTKEIKDLKSKEVNSNTKIYQMTTQIYQMTKEINYLKNKEVNSNTQIYQMTTQISQMTKEIDHLKIKEVNSNDQLNIIKNDKKELDQKIEEMKLQINDLRAFDIRIIKNLNEFEEVFKCININNLINDKNLKNEIKLLNDKLKILENSLCLIKEDVSKKNKKNIEEIIRLEKEIKELKIKIKELQNVLVGRKLIKIILKIIIENCFKNYYSIGNTINVQELKNQKYCPFKKIANNLIDIILKNNKIIHINDEINQIIDIINNKTTYGDILNLIKDSLKQNDYENILKLLNEKLLFNEICKEQLIGPDEDLSIIINKL